MIIEIIKKKATKRWRNQERGIKAQRIGIAHEKGIRETQLFRYSKENGMISENVEYLVEEHKERIYERQE